MTHYGEIAAFATACCWVVTGISFEFAGKRVGSLAVNLIRLVMAFMIMTGFTLITRGMALPLDATPHAWFWLVISGLIGFVIGDLFLFQAYVLIGARISMLIMATVPPITAVLGVFFLNEGLTVPTLIGMALTFTGIAMVILVRNDAGGKIEFSHSVRGLLYAFMGALGQAFGLVSSKIGMGSYDAFSSTQIRIMAGIVGFLVIYAIGNHWHIIPKAFKDRKGMGFITLGAFFGPFLGVSLSLVAIQNTEAAIASTIMSIMPVLIIPVSVLAFKEVIKTKELIGAVVTVIGVVILFL